MWQKLRVSHSTQFECNSAGHVHSYSHAFDQSSYDSSFQMMSVEESGRYALPQGWLSPLISILLQLCLSLSLKDRGIPTFLGRHGNAAARKKGRERRGGGGGGGVQGLGWGCVNNANATPLIIDCVFAPHPSSPFTQPEPFDTHTHFLPHLFPRFHPITLIPSSLLLRSGPGLPFPCGFKNSSLRSTVAVIIIIISGSFNRRRWYPQQPAEGLLVPW